MVDLDVHQGDGTADCLALCPELFTLSIHCENNYPAHKIAGDLDIGLPDRLDDVGYLDDPARAPARRSSTPSRPTSCSTMPASIPTGTIASGGCASPTTGLLARDRFVVAQARARGIPLVAVIGGGYTTDVEALAQRHALVFEAMAAEAAAAPASA